MLCDLKVCYETRFKCEKCTRTFKTSKYLGKHFKLKHSKTSKVVTNKVESNFENVSRMNMSLENSVRVRKSDVILRNNAPFNDIDLLSELKNEAMMLCNCRKGYNVRSEQDMCH
jgi:hypothetical protein